MNVRHVDDFSGDTAGAGAEVTGFLMTPALLPLEPAGSNKGQRALFRNAVIVISRGVRDTQKKMKTFY